MKECCANCKLMFKAHKTDFRKLNRTDEPIDYELDGFICMGLGHERVATWMVGTDAETGLCEMFKPKVSEIQNSSEKPNNCEDEFFREPTAEERKAVADYIDSISVPMGVNVFDLMDEPQTNADKFKRVFGLCATEVWSMYEADFLEWLNEKHRWKGESND